MANLKRWIVRAWRWRVEVRPVPNLLFYGCGCAAAAWLPVGTVRGVQAVMLGVIAILAVALVPLFVSAWRQRRKAGEARERVVYRAQLSPGHEPHEVAAAFGLEIARRINKAGRKGHAGER